MRHFWSDFEPLCYYPVRWALCHNLIHSPFARLLYAFWNNCRVWCPKTWYTIRTLLASKVWKNDLYAKRRKDWLTKWPKFTVGENYPQKSHFTSLRAKRAKVIFKLVNWAVCLHLFYELQLFVYMYYNTIVSCLFTFMLPKSAVCLH